MDLVRIIPAYRFTGVPAPAHRPYAFYADGFSLHERTIAECYCLVKGLSLPPRGPYEKERRTPFCWTDYLCDADSPLVASGASDTGKLEFEEPSVEQLENIEFIVLSVSFSQA